MRSRRGMSFVMALVFFLTCALLGSAMLSMAQVYGKRTVIKPEREAGYLSVVSAMELVKGQLEACGGVWDSELPAAETTQQLQGQILKELKSFCKAYQRNPYEAGRTRILSISLEADKGERWKRSEVMAVMTFRGLSLSESSLADIGDDEIPFCIETVFSLAEEGEEPLMSLNALGVAIYEEDDYMEVRWEEIIAGRAKE